MKSSLVMDFRGSEMLEDWGLSRKKSSRVRKWGLVVVFIRNYMGFLVIVVRFFL